MEREAALDVEPPSFWLPGGHSATGDIEGTVAYRRYRTAPAAVLLFFRLLMLPFNSFCMFLEFHTFLLTSWKDTNHGLSLFCRR